MEIDLKVPESIDFSEFPVSESVRKETSETQRKTPERINKN